MVAKVDLGNGQSVEAWTYNGGLPGPLIRTKVGDRLIVHFTNRLPAPTTVHWHGVRLPMGDNCSMLTAATLQPVAADRIEQLWTLEELLRTGGYDRLVVPPEFDPRQLAELAPPRMIIEAMCYLLAGDPVPDDLA